MSLMYIFHPPSKSSGRSTWRKICGSPSVASTPSAKRHLQCRWSTVQRPGFSGVELVGQRLGGSVGLWVGVESPDS